MHNAYRSVRNWKIVLRLAVFTLLVMLTACQTAAPYPSNAADQTNGSAPRAALAGTNSTRTPLAQQVTDTPQFSNGKKSPTPTPMPAGPLVAYVRDGRIWVDAGDSGAWPVTAGPGDDAPVFSPNGQWILFRRMLPVEGDQPPLWELRLASLNGALEKPVAGQHNLPGRVPLEPVWSPDGSQIAFETQPQCGMCRPNEDLWIYDLASETAKTILYEEEGGRKIFSPDGKFLAISSRVEIFVIDVNGKNRRTLLVYDPIIYLDGYHYPLLAWTQDSQAMLAAVPPKDQMQLLMGQAPDSTESRTSLWRLWLNGDADLLAQLERVNGSMWSPDSSLFAYSEIGTARLVIAAVDSGAIVYESVGLFENWSPDSRHFTFLPDLPGKTFWLDDMELGSIDGSVWPLVPKKEAAGMRPPTWVDASHFLYLAKIGEGIDGQGFEIRLKQVDGSYRLIYASADRWLPTDYAVHAP
jgi:dipeptidyl aminopeptidase/acylaminoacyl peptidase